MSPSQSMGGHESPVSATTTWLTPPHIIAALGEFDLDPCAVPGWRTAARGIYLPTDGLSVDWEGRVWCNPPYDDAWTWLAKLASHGTGTALIFARTETAGFASEVWGKATAVLFLRKRLHFHRADGTRARGNAGAPSALVAYGEMDSNRLRMSGLHGTYIDKWINTDGTYQP